jgi:outer membrane protein assembly factor BamB
VGDLVFIGSCSRNFYALDRGTGQPRWSYDITGDGPQSSFHGQPLVAGDLILTDTDNADRPSAIGHVYAFEQATGRVRWKHLVDGGTASDVVGTGGRVYVIAMDHRVLCLNLADGEPIWTFKPDAAGPPIPSNPLTVSGDRVFCKGGSGTLLALEAGSGRVIWERDLGVPITTGFVPMGDAILLGTGDGRLHRLDRATGEVTLSSDSTEIMARQPARFADSLAFFLGQQSLSCVDRRLRVRWRCQFAAPVGSSQPFLWGDRVLVGTQTGELAAFDAHDGRPLWSHGFSGLVRGVATAGGMLYVATLPGKVFAYAPPGGR